MDVVLQDVDCTDLRPLAPTSLECAFGVGDQAENTIELVMPDTAPAMEAGQVVYVEGTEYGGMLTRLSTKSGTVWDGLSWGGLLAAKVIVPDGGTGTLTVSGDANDVLRSLVKRAGLTDLFAVSPGKSALKALQSYTFAAYADYLAGIDAMLASVGGKLRMRHDGHQMVLSALPLKDWSVDEEFDASQVEVSVDIDHVPTNHLVARGKDSKDNRVSVDLYMDESGNVSETQSLKGRFEVAKYYDYTNADRDKLVEDGTKRLKGYWDKSRSVSLKLSADRDRYDVGDRIGGTDPASGVSATATIVKKVVTLDSRGVSGVTYETGSR